MRADGGGLAEVQRVRQYFPETWLWDELMTDAQRPGATLPVERPGLHHHLDAARRRPVSKDKGLGIAEDELKVFQPFFVQR